MKTETTPIGITLFIPIPMDVDEETDVLERLCDHLGVDINVENELADGLIVEITQVDYITPYSLARDCSIFLHNFFNAKEVNDGV